MTKTSPKGSKGKDSCMGQTHEKKINSQSQLIGQITKSLSASKNAENNVKCWKFANHRNYNVCGLPIST